MGGFSPPGSVKARYTARELSHAYFKRVAALSFFLYPQPCRSAGISPPLSVVKPEVDIRNYQNAGEGETWSEGGWGQDSGGGFIIGRNGAAGYNEDLTVELEYNGTDAVHGQDFTAKTTAVILAHTTSVFVAWRPTDDAKPEWNEEAKVSITESEDYTVKSGAGEASGWIVDNEANPVEVPSQIFTNFNDDNGRTGRDWSDDLPVGHDPDLHQIDLYFPDGEPKYNALVELYTGWYGPNCKLWEDQSKSKLVVSSDGGGYASFPHDEVPGLQSAGHARLYLEAGSPSSSPDDLVITINRSERSDTDYNFPSSGTSGEGRTTVKTGPTVDISVDDRAAETAQGAPPAPGYFTVSRSGGDNSQAVTVNLAFQGGTASTSDYALKDERTGAPVSGSVNIPPGEYSTRVVVTPAVEQTPEWTETVVATIVKVSGHQYYLGTSTTATAEIVDDDLVVQINAESGPDGNPAVWLNNNDSNGNGVPDMDPGEVGSDPDLKPLVLTYPQEIKSGATITLSADTGRVRVWKDSSRGELLLGDSQSSREWVVGSDALPTQAVVEGVGGSSSLGDTAITLSASDATALQAPRRSSTRSATTLAAVPHVSIKRSVANQPIEDVTQKLSKVIVGENLTLIGVWGPEDFFPQQPTHVWDVPGERVNGYTPNNNTGTVHSLTPAMLADSGLVFYWVDGGDPADVNKGARRAVTFDITARTGVVRRQAIFEVVRPKVTVTATSSGADGVVVLTTPEAGGRTKGALSFNGGLRAGMEFKAPPGQRQLPAGFGGTFQWVQVLRGQSSVQNAQGGWHHNTYPIWNALDTGYPYSNRQDGVEDGPAMWTFAPAAVKMRKDNTYEMHYMFKPDKPGSIAVPMKKIVWTWGGTATWDGAKWNGAGLFATEQPFVQDTTTHPQWSINHLNVAWDPPLLPGMQ